MTDALPRCCGSCHFADPETELCRWAESPSGHGLAVPFWFRPQLVYVDHDEGRECPAWRSL